MAEFVFTARHDLYYSNHDPVPIADIIESLRGVESLIKMSPRALSALTGVDIQRVEVFVQHLESGSLREEILIRFFFGSKEALLQFVDKVRGTMGENAVRNIVIGAVLASMFYYAAGLLADSSGGSTTAIHDNKVTIINIGAGEVQMTPESFKAVVEAAVSDKKELAASAVSILKPIRSDSQASLTFDDNKNFVVPPEVSQEVPTKVQLKPDTKVETELKAELRIRNSNRDSTKSGWQARIPHRFGQNKITLKLADGIDPEDLAGKSQIVGDVNIHYRVNSTTRQYEPTHMELIRLR